MSHTIYTTTPSHELIPIFMDTITDIVAAFHYAAECHSDQRRKDIKTTPYINHPIEVANFLAKHGVVDRDVIIGAVLHDVIEDTNGTAEEISQKFGESVKLIVEECSDNKSLGKVRRKRIQVSHAKHISPEAKLVKLADKYSNVSGLLNNAPSEWTKEIVIGYVYWSMAVCRNLFGVLESVDADLIGLFKKHGVDTDMSDDDLQIHIEKYYETINEVEKVHQAQSKIVFISQ